jgi:hypothetical protein
MSVHFEPASTSSPPAESLLEFAKRYKLVIAAIFLAVVTMMITVIAQQYSNTTPVVRDGETTIGACGPPACPAHRKKDPITGACTIPC